MPGGFDQYPPELQANLRSPRGVPEKVVINEGGGSSQPQKQEVLDPAMLRQQRLSAFRQEMCASMPASQKVTISSEPKPSSKYGLLPWYWKPNLRTLLIRADLEKVTPEEYLTRLSLDDEDYSQLFAEVAEWREKHPQ